MFCKLGLMIADLFIGESKHKKSSPLVSIKEMEDLMLEIVSGHRCHLYLLLMKIPFKM